MNCSKYKSNLSILGYASCNFSEDDENVIKIKLATYATAHCRADEKNCVIKNVNWDSIAELLCKGCRDKYLVKLGWTEPLFKH
jgi:hypothetical protein